MVFSTLRVCQEFEEDKTKTKYTFLDIHLGVLLTYETII